MKKLLLSFFFLLSFSSKAQTSVYHPFPDSNATWCCSARFSDSECCMYADVNYTLINQDTLINDTSYHKLIYYQVQDVMNCIGCIFCCPFPSHTINEGTSYIRQDVFTKQVFIRKYADGNEVILYDFNLQIGDTLTSSKVCWWDAGFGGAYVVTSIDSALIGNEYRTRYNYRSGCSALSIDSSMIEGICSLHGLMYPPGCHEGWNSLNKFIQNDSTVYEGPFSNECLALPTKVNNLSLLDFIIISPNPFTTHLSITLQKENIRSATFTIKNILGETLLKSELKNLESEIDLSQLSQGVYFLEVVMGGERVVRKIVKE